MTTRAPGQRIEALLKANENRIKKAQIKSDLKTRHISFRDILMDPPEYLLSAKISEIVRAIPRIGPEKTKRLLVSWEISPNTTFGSITDRQRNKIIEQLEN